MRRTNGCLMRHTPFGGFCRGLPCTPYRISWHISSVAGFVAWSAPSARALTLPDLPTTQPWYPTDWASWPTTNSCLESWLFLRWSTRYRTANFRVFHVAALCSWKWDRPWKPASSAARLCWTRVFDQLVEYRTCSLTCQSSRWEISQIITWPDLHRWYAYLFQL